MKAISIRFPLAWAGLVIVLDQLSKIWVVNSFELHESLSLIPGFFSLTYITNTGAAFGMLAGQQGLGRQLFFGAVAILALLVLYFAFREYRQRGRLYMAAIGLVAGGAVGNLLDRLRLGHVIDFLDVYYRRYHWPAFNVADSAITIGVALFILASFRDRETGEK